MSDLHPDLAAKLPEFCYAVGATGGVILLKRGERGYWPVSPPSAHDEEAVATLNKRLGVTLSQRYAMEIGSMFGFHVPGADPDRHRKVAGEA